MNQLKLFSARAVEAVSVVNKCVGYKFKRQSFKSNFLICKRRSVKVAICLCCSW